MKKIGVMLLVLCMLVVFSVPAEALTLRQEWGHFPTQNTSTHTYYGTKAVQYCLGLSGHHVTIDGNFGSITEAAVFDYQHDNNLTEDGSVGSQTWQYFFDTMTDHLNHATNSGNHYYIFLPISGTNYLTDYNFCRKSGAWKYKGGYTIKSGF